jgi:hypothetical protein
MEPRKQVKKMPIGKRVFAAILGGVLIVFSFWIGMGGGSFVGCGLMAIFLGLLVLVGGVLLYAAITGTDIIIPRWLQ